MPTWLNELISFAANDPYVMVAAGSILIVAFFGYQIAFAPHLRSVQHGLNSIKELFNSKDLTWDVLQIKIPEIIQKHPILKTAWRETQERVIVLPLNQKNTAVTLYPLNDLWTPQRLLHRRMNLSLYEAMPNILVGVGLLFTFFFLSKALTEATAALVGAQETQGQLVKATQSLLSTAGAKFVTSLCGLLASIIWTFSAKRCISTLERSGDDVANLINTSVKSSGSELLMFEQLQISNSLLLTVREQNELIEEGLIESREQTAALKRFETDLAVSLAKAITTAFTPQMEGMTQQLVSAIEGLSEKMGAMNQEALTNMMKEFSTTIQDANSEEMQIFKDSLVKIADKLEITSIQLGTRIEEAGDSLNEASGNLAKNIDVAAQALTESSTLLNQAMSETKLTVNDLDHTISQASDAGKQGLSEFKLAISDTDQMLKQLTTTGKTWLEAGTDLRESADSLSELIASIDELTQDQKLVLEAVSSAPAAAMRIISEISEVMKIAGRQIESSMEKTKDSMLNANHSLEKTAAVIEKSVDSVQNGIREYTDQVATLHNKMDENMSSAVNAMGGSIENLSEAVEELSEVLEIKIPKS